MKKMFMAVLSSLAIALAMAEPVQVSRPCEFCRGRLFGGPRGPVSLTPPNLGQHDGEIGVTAGKPFTNHRWDVKVPRCPFCDGTRRRTLWKFNPPAEPMPEGFERCTACWRSGAEKCRKCKGDGYVPCRKCGSSSGKPGWTKEEQTTGGTRSRHKKIVVTPCGECQGFGKVPCADCRGLGGDPCRKCKGEGVTPKKERR